MQKPHLPYRPLLLAVVLSGFSLFPNWKGSGSVTVGGIDDLKDAIAFDYDFDLTDFYYGGSVGYEHRKSATHPGWAWVTSLGYLYNKHDDFSKVIVGTVGINHRHLFNSSFSGDISIILAPNILMYEKEWDIFLPFHLFPIVFLGGNYHLKNGSTLGLCVLGSAIPSLMLKFTIPLDAQKDPN